jgi:YggT family protein
VVQLIVTLLNLYLIALLARIILSWFPISEGGVMGSIMRFLYAITEPVLAPLRAVLPPVRMGSMALDLSPLIVLLGLQLLIAFIGR